ncbi:hypothetical protein PInf_012145 [Phytophthora infestans]|nr:hypothetical protein PInf_012145 [Phytophthora infestans]
MKDFHKSPKRADQTSPIWWTTSVQNWYQTLEAELGPLNRPSTYIKTIKIALLPPTQPTVSAQLRGKSYWDDKMELVIDARTYGNEIRFINHSCRLNCASYDFGWANTSRLGIFAVRDISPM